MLRITTDYWGEGLLRITRDYKHSTRGLHFEPPRWEEGTKSLLGTPGALGLDYRLLGLEHSVQDSPRGPGTPGAASGQKARSLADECRGAHRKRGLGPSLRRPSEARRRKPRVESTRRSTVRIPVAFCAFVGFKQMSLLSYASLRLLLLFT